MWYYCVDRAIINWHTACGGANKMQFNKSAKKNR